LRLRKKTYRILLIFSLSLTINSNIFAQSPALQAMDGQYEEVFNSHIEKITKKSDNKTKDFLEYIFYKTHKKFLNHYKKYTSLNESFNSGYYDCVSGTLLYAKILNHFNIQTEIIETDFHVFLIAKTETQEFIFEATDPLYGFIEDPKEIAQYKLKFKPQAGSFGLSSAIEIGNQSYINSDENTIYNQISMQQLNGLQFYNKGILALNEHAYEAAHTQLKTAFSLYPSERIDAILSISKSLLDQ